MYFAGSRGPNADQTWGRSSRGLETHLLIRRWTHPVHKSPQPSIPSGTKRFAVHTRLAGGYIVWFWATNLTSGAGALGAAGPFRFVEDLSQRVQDLIAASPLLVSAVLIAVIVAGIVAARVARRQGVDVHN